MNQDVDVTLSSFQLFKMGNIKKTYPHKSVLTTQVKKPNIFLFF